MTIKDLEYLDLRVTSRGVIRCVAEDLVVDEFDLEIDAGWKAAAAMCQLANHETARADREQAAADRIRRQMSRWCTAAVAAIAVLGLDLFLAREGNGMTWKEKLICRILLMIAGMAADDRELRAELQHLSNHITQAKREDIAA